MRGKPHIVAIGILARNEAAHIGTLINDLGRQTILSEVGVAVQIFVVANGCTDSTVEVARAALEAPSFPAAITGSVHNLDQAGKSNAWNALIHEIVPNSTEFIFLLDGDIRLPEPDSLLLLLRALLTVPEAVVAVDRSVKDLQLEKPRTLVERVIGVATGTANDPRTAVAGALYCARYADVRNIWMPIGLPGEDGFLRAMLLTSSFSKDEQLAKHVYVDEAFHVFEGLRTFSAVYRHNVRLAIGTGINILLFEHLRKIVAAGLDANRYIRGRNAEDPNWINNLINERIRRSYFPLHLRFLVRRLDASRYFPRMPIFKRVFILFIGLLFDFAVFLKATVMMRRGVGAGYW